MTTLDCALAGQCGGCPWIGQPLDTQRDRRTATLRAHWAKADLPGTPSPTWHGVGVGALRDRVDLTLKKHEGAAILGMFAADGSGLIDLPTCPLLTPALADWLADFRADLPDIPRAGVRLRVGPDGQRGVWLDLPNTTTRDLLQSGAWLSRLASRAAVEIGQKRKDLLVDRMKLAKPQPKPTFATWIEGRSVPLYGAIGGFSQPGMAANRVLVEAVLVQAAARPARRWLELCAGSGNFTLPLAAAGAEVLAWEVDRLALAGLRRASAEQGLTIATEALNIHRPSQRLHDALAAAAPEAILADPPRSGLGGFLTVLAAQPSRPDILYVSCAVESLVADIAALHPLGYRLRSLAGIDQFPHTPHSEWVAVLSADQGSS